MRFIAIAFVGLAIYLIAQSVTVLAVGFRPHHSLLGIIWTAVTAAVMFAVAVLVGLTLNATLGWWWADPAAGFVIVYYAVKGARTILGDLRED